MKKSETEGIFYDWRNGRWNEFNNWPKGKTKARFIYVRNGETSVPFGDSSLTKNQAVAMVEDWKRRKMETLGYTRFAIVPYIAPEMDEAAKSRLRKARDAKKTVPAEEC